MKAKKISQSVAVILFCSLGIFICRLNAEPKLPLPLGSVVPATEPEISMDFRDVSLKDLLKIFSIQSGLNFISSPQVEDRKVTLYLDKIPLSKAMEKLFTANDLYYELDKDANIFLVKKLDKATAAKTVTRIFFLKYASVSVSPVIKEIDDKLSAEGGTGGGTSGGTAGGGATQQQEGGRSAILDTVKKLLSESGTAIEDIRTNSLIVTDLPVRMAVIEQAIVALDIPIPQIMLEVEMLDVNKNLVERLGIKYADSLTTYMFTAVLKSATVTTPFPFAGGLYSDKTQTQGAKQFTQGTLNLKDYNAYLDFLKQQSDTRTLARPRIRTMSNETAEIMITTQEAIGSITVQQGTGANVTQTITAERVETGIHLRVTPQVNSETGDITMFIYPKVKDTVASVLNPSTWKDPEERSVKSILRMKDGDTVIIGGLIRKDDSETVTKLPFLGDLPLIGGAFRHKYKDKGKERELLVFITPRIIKDSGVMLAQAKKGAFPEREQGASSGVKRDLAINSTLNKFEKKKKR